MDFTLVSSAPRKVAARRPRYRRFGIIFSIPALVAFAIFFVWPLILTFYYSFTNYSPYGGTTDFIGLDNFVSLFADPAFTKALGRTLLFAIIEVPVIVVASLASASLLAAPTGGFKTFAKFAFFFPWLLSSIITGIIWRWLFGESFGLVNSVLDSLFGFTLPWQTDSTLSLLVVVAAAAWSDMAFQMLLYYAALRNVPPELYEAAALDGAGPWARLWYISIPSIRHTTFMVVLISILNAVKQFAMVQTLTNGGPGTDNTFIVQYIYQTGFSLKLYGYASAASVVLMLLLLLVTGIQFALNRSEREED